MGDFPGFESREGGGRLSSASHVSDLWRRRHRQESPGVVVVVARHTHKIHFKSILKHIKINEIKWINFEWGIKMVWVGGEITLAHNKQYSYSRFF